MTEWNHPFFRPEELSCHCGCGGLPKEFFIHWLETLRQELGFPLRVSSGFRCAEYNKKIAHSGSDGAHTEGVAADILICGAEAHALLVSALKHGVQGIGVSQKGPMAVRYLHLDLVDDGKKPRPTVWSY